MRASAGNSNYIYRVKDDGSGRQRVGSSAVVFLGPVAPDNQWVMAAIPSQREDHPLEFAAVPTAGGSPRPICGACDPDWSADGKYFVVTNHGIGLMTQEKTYVIPLRKGEDFPPIPSAGLTTDKEIAGLPGVRVINRADVAIGTDPATYAFTDATAHRNLFRIPLP